MSVNDTEVRRFAPRQGVTVRRIWDELIQDRARRAHKPAPSPPLVLLSSSLLALLICGLYRYGERLGLKPIQEWVFAKEGLLEDLTFLAELAAAVFMVAAARRVWLQSSDASRPLITAAYAGLAALLFLVAMEEIGWGQQLLHFSTPERWAQINSQHETTLHNMLDREGVMTLGRWIRFSFVLVAVTLTVLGITSGNELIQALAPHPSLLVLTSAIAGSAFLHGEVLEALVAFYFVFYSYRVFRISAGGRAPS